MPKNPRTIALLAATAVGMGVFLAAPASAMTVSVTKSSAVLNLGTGTTATEDARIVYSKQVHQEPGSQAATIVVSLKDDNGNPITTDVLRATSSGAGSLGTGSGPASNFIPTGQNIPVSVSSTVSGKYVLALFPDGIAGFSSITIFDGTTLLATKFAAFYGAVSSLTAIQNLFIVNVAGGTLGSNSVDNPADGTYVHTPAVILIARDANGVPVPNEPADQFSAISSDPAILSPTISVLNDNSLGAGSVDYGAYNVQVSSGNGGVSGKSATLIFRYTDDKVKYISTTALKFTTGSTTIASVLMTFDKESYAPGEQAILTLNAFDPSGNPVSGQDSGNFFATSTGLVTSAPVEKLLFPFTTVTFIHGRSTMSFDMPTTSGEFTVSGLLGNNTNLIPALQGSKLVAGTSVLTAQAAQFADAKASAAASELAATAALAAVVSLTALVQRLLTIIARIQKRLHMK
jgi:hypothetical protein